MVPPDGARDGVRIGVVRRSCLRRSGEVRRRHQRVPLCGGGRLVGPGGHGVGYPDVGRDPARRRAVHRSAGAAGDPVPVARDPDGGGRAGARLRQRGRRQRQSRSTIRSARESRTRSPGRWRFTTGTVPVNSRRQDGDEIAIRNAIASADAGVGEAIHDPYVSPGVLGEAVKTNVADVKFVPGVTDFPTTPQPAPDNRVVRALEQGPQVIPYLSQGLTSDDVVGARPDDRADRFAHSNVQTPRRGLGKRLDVRMERRADGGDRRARSRPRPRTGARLPAPAPARRTLGRLGSDAKRALRGPLSCGPTVLGFAGVEALLEELPQLLAGRQHVLVPRPARRQLHDPDVVVAHAVTAGVRSGLVERCEPGAAAEAHERGILDVAVMGRQKRRRGLRKDPGRLLGWARLEGRDTARFPRPAREVRKEALRREREYNAGKPACKPRDENPARAGLFRASCGTRIRT